MLFLILCLLLFIVFPTLYIIFDMTFFTWGIIIEINTQAVMKQRINELAILATFVYQFIFELIVTIIDFIKPLLQALAKKILGDTTTGEV